MDKKLKDVIETVGKGVKVLLIVVAMAFGGYGEPGTNNGGTTPLSNSERAVATATYVDDCLNGRHSNHGHIWSSSQGCIGNYLYENNQGVHTALEGFMVREIGQIIEFDVISSEVSNNRTGVRRIGRIPVETSECGTYQYDTVVIDMDLY